MTPSITAAGDQGFLIRFGDTSDSALSDLVLGATSALALGDGSPPGVEDVVPGHACLLVVLDAGRADASQVRAWIDSALASALPLAQCTGRTIEIPVLYHPSVAPDLEALAAQKGLSVAALVGLHTAPTYRCRLLGFRPGFPYLAGLDPRLHTPRLATPRVRVPAGTVGIGGRQTGIYPVDSPGGWRLLGRTPLRLFDPAGADPFAIHAGDRVRFAPIDQATFASLGEGPS